MHENHARNRQQAAIIAIATVLVVSLPHDASAERRTTTPIVFPSDKVKVIVSDDGDSFDLRAHDERLTLMEFHEPVIDVDSASEHYYAKRRGKHLVEVKIRKNATPDASTLTVEIESGAIVNIGLIPTKEATEVPKYVEIETVSREALERRRRDRQIAEQLLTREYWRAVPTTTAGERDGPIHATILGFQTTEETDADSGDVIYRRFVVFSLENRRSIPFRLTAIHILENERGHHLADVVSIDQRGSTEGGRLLATVAPNSTLRGQVLVPDDIQSAKHELALTFTDAASTMPLIAATEKADFVLVPNDQYDYMHRELALARQVTFGVHAIGGVMWLPNPQDNTRMALTSFSGVGIRSAYGLHSSFAVEGVVAVAKTGDASFDDTWNGMQGRLDRRATMGRALFSGVLRMGHRYVPMLRVGLGFQFGSQSADFTPTNGATMDGPDLGFQAVGFWSLGLGFDVRVRDFWHMGIRANFSEAMDSTSRAMEAGIHFGYGWLRQQPKTAR